MSFPVSAALSAPPSAADSDEGVDELAGVDAAGSEDSGFAAESAYVEVAALAVFAASEAFAAGSTFAVEIVVVVVEVVLVSVLPPASGVDPSVLFAADGSYFALPSAVAAVVEAAVVLSPAGTCSVVVVTLLTMQLVPFQFEPSGQDKHFPFVKKNLALQEILA